MYIKKTEKMKRQDIFLIILARRPAELTAVGAACDVPSPVMKSIWLKLFQVTFNESLNICRRKDAQDKSSPNHPFISVFLFFRLDWRMIRIPLR